MAIAFPERNAAQLAREWMTRPFRDYVGVRRVVIGGDKVANLAVESRGEPAIIRDPDQSLIIALGHFSREANVGLYKSGVVPKQVAATIAALDRPSLRPRAIRVRMQILEIMAGIRAARDNDVDIVPFDGPGALTKLVRLLKRPGTAVTISADAVLAQGRESGLDRAFAGHRCMSFALGTARLARLSQRPIVPCVPFLDENGGFVVEWGEPIPAPGRDDESADVRITDAILDIFERAIGARPGQYVLSIGSDRGWDETAQRWVSL